MNIPNPLKLIKWRLVIAALISVGILHIVATFATPSLTGCPHSLGCGQNCR